MKILVTEVEQLRSQLEGEKAARLQSQEQAESSAAQITSLSLQITSLWLKLSETEKCVIISRAEAAASKKSLQLVYQSRSWRMTRAYRALELEIPAHNPDRALQSNLRIG